MLLFDKILQAVDLSKLESDTTFTKTMRVAIGVSDKLGP